jgi:small-conductance mechanosensitive channel
MTRCLDLLRAAVVAASFLVVATHGEPVSGAPGWDLWGKKAPTAAPEHPSANQRGPKEEKEKALTPRRVGDEIQGILTSIDLYRSEIESKKKELAELKEKRLRLAEIEEKLLREKDPKSRRDLLADRAKAGEEITALVARTAGNEGLVRAREAAVAELERSLQDLRQRQQAIYLRYLYRFLMAGGVIAVAWGIARFTAAIIDRIVREESRRVGLKRLVRGIVYITAFLLALLTGLENPTQLAAFLAVFSAGLAIALKDFLSCCIGWFMLVFTRQIRVGDIVEIGPVKGRVTDISILKTTVLEWRDYRETGRTAFFGNNFIFSYPLYNSSLRGGDIIDTIDIRLPPGADSHRFVQALRQTGEALRQRGEVGEFSVVITFDQGGGALSLTFRAQPYEIPRIREMIAAVTAGMIWEQTAGPTA